MNTSPLYLFAADIVLLLHFLFILFVLAGGLMVFRWPWLAWLHVPATVWGAVVVIADWICPLTPLENMLRQAGGAPGYSGSFIERYLFPVVYPAGLDRKMFIAMGIAVIVINLAVYTGLVLRKNRADRNRGRQ